MINGYEGSWGHVTYPEEGLSKRKQGVWKNVTRQSATENFPTEVSSLRYQLFLNLD